MSRVPRRARILLWLVAAFVLAVVLVAPVALRGPGGKPCAKTLEYKGRSYTARAASSFVQSIAIGVGVASGCGSTPANVDIRSLAGIRPSRAIAVPTDESSIYVRKGLCRSASSLLRCLRD